jgi:hypothetical protein
MNVSVTTATVETGDHQTMKKNILTVTKDIKAGEVIYKVAILYRIALYYR